MNTKKITKAGMLLAIGTVLHYIVPPLFLGVKPDFLLATMFIGLMIVDDIKSAISIALAAGILSALTTGFPGGEIPNIIDKLVSGLFVFYLYHGLLKELSKSTSSFLIGLLGTVISGGVFLASALVIVGIPFTFMAGMIGIVMPTAIANSIMLIFLAKVSKIAEQQLAN
ncbi:MAG: tryptophan transporter [Tissierellia bacterium]|nr:tryptophan transporter [Tissierellia bacterium]